MNELRFAVAPKPAGYLQIGSSLWLEVNKKPWFIHRLMVRLVFGFKWSDAS